MRYKTALSFPIESGSVLVLGLALIVQYVGLSLDTVPYGSAIAKLLWLHLDLADTLAFSIDRTLALIATVAACLMLYQPMVPVYIGLGCYGLL